jgi:hypothetical protein
MNDLRIIGRGGLHPADKCTFCSATEHLVRFVLADTLAVAMRCDDPIACQRRRYVQRQAS